MINFAFNYWNFKLHLYNHKVKSIENTYFILIRLRYQNGYKNLTLSSIFIIYINKYILMNKVLILAGLTVLIGSLAYLTADTKTQESSGFAEYK